MQSLSDDGLCIMWFYIVQPNFIEKSVCIFLVTQRQLCVHYWRHRDSSFSISVQQMIKLLLQRTKHYNTLNTVAIHIQYWHFKHYCAFSTISFRFMGPKTHLHATACKRRNLFQKWQLKMQRYEQVGWTQPHGPFAMSPRSSCWLHKILPFSPWYSDS